MTETAENLESQVKEIISRQLMVDEKELTSDANYVEDLGADSIDKVEMIMELQDEFGIEIPNEDADKLTTVGETIDYLKDDLEED